ncbi:MAG: MotA/TolQ/ExbB proton channel family protein [Candidatus Aminicenantes bacterium]|uniref:MotA/TolQ/ExbB proton channel family protein n=1 Tax=Candidatus Saccharicenans subterraneus TaxID=2508984 RepID=A0A3E2BLA7_9BACT|nr:MotA/TolQ/ExbB proton channel family protein [Candidatus Aminicenantes bacterium]RFT15533.1 MAG: MotA/TolQ/ExbB proton channel family protein [Candidatus Saccharicenans subterraneum]
MQFGLIEMWQAMGVVAKTVAIILILLSVITIYLFIERQLVFARARKKSLAVAPKLAELMKNGQLKEAMALASKKENKVSHLARVTAAGIEEFLGAKDSNLTVEEQIESAQRGCERARSLFTQELKRGLSIMATIATSSPFIGLFGTIFGIINAFRGMAMTGSGGIGAVAAGIAEALVTTAFGIAVAVIALWTFNSLNTKIEVYNTEMENTTSQIVDYFIRTSGK